jgi:hypothetical protein
LNQSGSTTLVFLKTAFTNLFIGKGRLIVTELWQAGENRTKLRLQFEPETIHKSDVLTFPVINVGGGGSLPKCSATQITLATEATSL